MDVQIVAPLYASVTTYVKDVGNEVVSYSGQMTTMHWGIVAASAVLFGFLCLKGPGLNR